jgi:hypothetical protein
MQKTIIYKNHTYENGVMTRGHATKRVIKPNAKGIYKIRCKGEVEHLTIADIMQGYKEPESAPIDPIPRGKLIQSEYSNRFTYERNVNN